MNITQKCKIKIISNINQKFLQSIILETMRVFYILMFYLRIAFTSGAAENKDLNGTEKLLLGHEKHTISTIGTGRYSEFLSSLDDLTSQPHFITMNENDFRRFESIIAPVDDEDVLLVFDIDSTLYPANLGIESSILNSIVEHVSKNTTLTEDEFSKTLKKEISTPDDHLIWKVNGKYGIECGFYNKSIDTIDYSTKISKDIELKNFLKSIKARKICFTNNSTFGGMKILEARDLLDCFEAVIGTDTEVQSTQFKKPLSESYDFVERLFRIGSKVSGSNGKKNVIFFDDRLRNVEKGNEIGWKSVHVLPDNNLQQLVTDNHNDWIIKKQS